MGEARRQWDLFLFWILIFPDCWYDLGSQQPTPSSTIVSRLHFLVMITKFLTTGYSKSLQCSSETVVEGVGVESWNSINRTLDALESEYPEECNMALLHFLVSCLGSLRCGWRRLGLPRILLFRVTSMYSRTSLLQTLWGLGLAALIREVSWVER